jgi:hypothetical protein
LGSFDAVLEQAHFKPAISTLFQPTIHASAAVDAVLRGSAVEPS